MKTTVRGTTYTTDRNEAFKFRIEDRSPNRGAKISGQMYTKWVKLYHYDKENKVYWLPPVTWDNTKWELESSYPIDVKPIMELWEGQQKTVDFCYDEFCKGTSSILIVSETATGKSIQMLGIIKRFKCRTIIVVPSEAIGLGIQEKLQPYCDARYLDGSKIRTAARLSDLPDVLITHRQSAVNCWNLINGIYDLMLNDEQHHLSDGMKMMCNTWKGRGIIGLTGTPFRKEMNQQDFLLYFQKIYETGLKSLPVRVLTHKYSHTYSMSDFVEASKGLEPESPEVLRRLVNANDDRLQEIKKVVSKLYFNYGFKRLILFVDRREYQEKIKSEIFPNAILINGDTDKEKVINELKDKDEFLIIGMVTASGEGFDIPSIECGILFYSTSWEGTLEQMIGRAKRFHGNKEYAYRLDFCEYSKIEPDMYKTFGARERLKWYKEKGFEIQSL